MLHIYISICVCIYIYICVFVGTYWFENVALSLSVENCSPSTHIKSFPSLVQGLYPLVPTGLAAYEGLTLTISPAPPPTGIYEITAVEVRPNGIIPLPRPGPARTGPGEGSRVRIRAVTLSDHYYP